MRRERTVRIPPRKLHFARKSGQLPLVLVEPRQILLARVAPNHKRQGENLPAYGPLGKRRLAPQDAFRLPDRLHQVRNGGLRRLLLVNLGAHDDLPQNLVVRKRPALAIQNVTAKPRRENRPHRLRLLLVLVERGLFQLHHLQFDGQDEESQEDEPARRGANKA